MLFTVFMVFHHLLSKLLLLAELTEVVNDDQTLQLFEFDLRLHLPFHPFHPPPPLPSSLTSSLSVF